MDCKYNVKSIADSLLCEYSSLLNEKLPIDSSGLCPLHSNDETWKVNNGYHVFLKKIMSRYLSKGFNKPANFDGCVFLPPIGETRKGHFGELFIPADNLIFENEVYFRGSKFLGLAFFNNTIFKKRAWFNFACFRSADFSRACFNKAYFINTIFDGYVDFEDVSFKGHVYFTDVFFHKRAYFQNTIFKSHTGFTRTNFLGFTNFHNAEFPTKWGVDFVDIRIQNAQQILFSGHSNLNKLFEKSLIDTVSFDLNFSKINGSIIFRFADIKKIKQRDILIKESQESEKIIIKEGCGSHYKIYIDNIEDIQRFKIRQCLMDAFKRFLLNQYDLDFSVKFNKKNNCYEIEFESIDYIPQDAWNAAKNKFNEAFENIMFECLKRDETLKEFLLENNSFDLSIHKDAQTTDGFKSGAISDLKIDCKSILERLKVYFNDNNELAQELRQVQTIASPRLENMKVEREICISYARGDDTPDGVERSKIVEQFCHMATQQGFKIIRDTTHLGLGESLIEFMERIGNGKRVIVFLSDKYLKSDYCVTELFDIWRNCSLDKNKFKDRVGVYRFQCANVFELEGRITYADYWAEKYNIISKKANTSNNSTSLGKRGYEELNRMQLFANQIGDIIDFFAEYVHPCNLEELERYEFFIYDKNNT